MTCINCPMGCQLDVEKLADGTLKVTGNACLRGETYAKQEVTAPVRMVTGLVRVKGTKRPLCVKTKVAIPKGKIPDVLAALAAGAELMARCGPDSPVGRTAAVMLGSTETTFYVITVYCGAAGVKKLRYAVPAALAADFAAFFTAALSVRLLYG